MSATRVLVGTRKGAFILSSNSDRKDWQVSGPHFAGWQHLGSEWTSPLFSDIDLRHSKKQMSD